MLQIHSNARTTPIIRTEIARSHERTGILAQRYGVSTDTGGPKGRPVCARGWWCGRAQNQ